MQDRLFKVGAQDSEAGHLPHELIDRSPRGITADDDAAEILFFVLPRFYWRDADDIFAARRIDDAVFIRPAFDFLPPCRLGGFFIRFFILAALPVFLDFHHVTDSRFGARRFTDVNNHGLMPRNSRRRDCTTSKSCSKSSASTAVAPSALLRLMTRLNSSASGRNSAHAC
jgi:hypothetical protein